MAEQSTKPVRTFFIGFEEWQYSETHFVRQIADRYKTDRREFIFGRFFTHDKLSLYADWWRDRFAQVDTAEWVTKRADRVHSIARFTPIM